MNDGAIGRTKFHSYVNLVNNFLFTSFGQNYYVYKIIETDTTVSPYTFYLYQPTPGVYFTFKPYSVHHSKDFIFALTRDSTGYKMMNFTWAKNSSLSPTTTSNSLFYF